MVRLFKSPWRLILVWVTRFGSKVAKMVSDEKGVKLP